MDIDIDKPLFMSIENLKEIISIFNKFMKDEHLIDITLEKQINLKKIMFNIMDKVNKSNQNKNLHINELNKITLKFTRSHIYNNFPKLFTHNTDNFNILHRENIVHGARENPTLKALNVDRNSIITNKKDSKLENDVSKRYININNQRSYQTPNSTQKNIPLFPSSSEQVLPENTDIIQSKMDLLIKQRTNDQEQISKYTSPNQKIDFQSSYLPNSNLNIFKNNSNFKTINTENNTVFNTENNTENNTDFNTGNNTDFNTGNNIGNNTDFNTGNNIDFNTGNNIGNNIGNNTGNNIDFNTGNNIGNNIGNNTDFNTGNNTDFNTGNNTKINTDFNTGNNTENNTENNTDFNTGNNTEFNTGNNTDFNTDNIKSDKLIFDFSQFDNLDDFDNNNDLTFDISQENKQIKENEQIKKNEQINDNKLTTQKQIIISHNIIDKNIKYTKNNKCLLSFTHKFQKPLNNILSIRLINVFANLLDGEFLILKLNDFSYIKSNHKCINNSFSTIYKNKIYHDIFFFNKPLSSLNKFSFNITSFYPISKKRYIDLQHLIFEFIIDSY
jgi:hypothetical protein